MYTLEERLGILTKIETSRHLYELIGNYETHAPIRCMFTDNLVVHEYHDSVDNTYLKGWAVNVQLSSGEWISCIASHYSYDETDIDDNDDFII